MEGGVPTRREGDQWVDHHQIYPSPVAHRQDLSLSRRTSTRTGAIWREGNAEKKKKNKRKEKWKKKKKKWLCSAGVHCHLSAVVVEPNISELQLWNPNYFSRKYIASNQFCLLLNTGWQTAVQLTPKRLHIGGLPGKKKKHSSVGKEKFVVVLSPNFTLPARRGIGSAVFIQPKKKRKTPWN